MDRLCITKRGWIQQASRQWPHLLAIIAALTVIVGCDSSENESEPEQTNVPITFNSSVVSALPHSSRGVPITDTDQTALLSAGVYAYSTGANNFNAATSKPDYMVNQLLSRTFDGNTPMDWTYSPSKYWPAAGNKLTFLAYSPHSTICSGFTLTQEDGVAYPKMDFTVDSKIEDQVDLLIADPVVDCEKSTGTVPLNMKHALTLISFSAAVKNSSTSDMIKINKITVTNVLSAGNTPVKTPITWSDLRTSTSYVLSIENGTLTDSALTTTMSLLNTAKGFLLLMPQPFNDEQAKIIIEYSSANGTEKIYEEQFFICYTEAVWQPGTAINYQILLNADKVEITASITPWEKKYFNGGDKENGNLPWE